MNYNKLKQEIKEIAEIASGVPEPFRNKCFETLLQHLLTSEKPASDKLPERKDEKPAEKDDTGQSNGGKIPLPAQVRVFMTKSGVTEDDLKSLFLYQDGELHFVREPATKKVAQGQMEWALLLALKNGILKNSLCADPEDVRSICQDKGFYDQANFAANFKKGTNATLFKKPLSPQGEAQSLSGDGQVALGKLVKTLIGKPSEAGNS